MSSLFVASYIAWQIAGTALVLIPVGGFELHRWPFGGGIFRVIANAATYCTLGAVVAGIVSAVFS